MKPLKFKPEAEIIQELTEICGKLLELADNIPLEKFASGNEWMGMDKGCLSTSILIEGSREKMKIIAVEVKARKDHSKKMKARMRKLRKK
jgi:hypothetical protein